MTINNQYMHEINFKKREEKLEHIPGLTGPFDYGSGVGGSDDSSYQISPQFATTGALQVALGFASKMLINRRYI